jgi:hypothetical protein
LPQSNVQGPNPPSDRRCKRAFNSDEVFFEGGDGVFGEPIVEAIFCGLSGEDLKPGDLARTLVRFVDSGVKYPFARSPNIRTCAIPTDERDYGIIGTLDDPVVSCDFVSNGRLNVLVCHSAAPREGEIYKNQNREESQSVKQKTLLSKWK